MSLQFRDKDVVWDHVNDLAQVQVHDISCPSFPTDAVTLTEYQIGQACSTLGEAMLAVSDHPVTSHVP